MVIRNNFYYIRELSLAEECSLKFCMHLIGLMQLINYYIPCVHSAYVQV
jgi:hypothetical protein